MAMDPYTLRKRALSEALSAHELGRALYHLAQRRHFRGRDLEESDDTTAEAADEKEAKTNRELTLQALKMEEVTLGAWLSERGPHDRKRGVHAHRTADPFEPPADISVALNRKGEWDFVETPLEDVIAFVRSASKIDAVINDRALEDNGLSSDTPITCQLRDISLRSSSELSWESSS